ncbi:MAG TPA: hypothetical protein VI796_04440, partial [Candidatus Thermoplasmatota archaeon]|nr:hypothetical protein [Candidatus Thermoplasmatota archaeon]
MRWLTVPLCLLLAGCGGAPDAENPADEDAAAMDAERGSSPPAADATAAGGETEATASWQGSTISSFCIWTEPVRDGCFGIH